MSVWHPPKLRFVQGVSGGCGNILQDDTRGNYKSKSSYDIF